MTSGWSNTSFGGGSPTPGAGIAGLVAGTWVATEQGWRPVETLSAGDLLPTFENGLRPVVELWRGTIACAAADLCPLLAPSGTLGNREDLVLMPGQPVMLDFEAAEDICGEPFLALPAAALEGWRGIRRIAPHGALDVVQPRFEAGETIYAHGAALICCAPAEVASMTRPRPIHGSPFAATAPGEPLWPVAARPAVAKRVSAPAADGRELSRRAGHQHASMR